MLVLNWDAVNIKIFANFVLRFFAVLPLIFFDTGEELTEAFATLLSLFLLQHLPQMLYLFFVRPRPKTEIYTNQITGAFAVALKPVFEHMIIEE